MKKVLTIIFDGFGINDNEKGNAIKKAGMPNFNKLWNTYPHSVLQASEEAVGLAKGQFGNSEVGHMTIGAGRLLKQNEVLVNEFLKEQDMNNKYLSKLLSDPTKNVHIMGLCSDGNVHAGIDDFISLYKILVEHDFKNIHFHIITDGRDTHPTDAMKYINEIKALIKEYGVGDIATICGRYYAMDRDKNWSRTKAYYNLVTKGKGEEVISIESSIKKSYSEDVTDEFIKPMLVSDNLINDGDILVWMNYRADRSKQILDAFVNSSTFDEFPVQVYKNLDVYTFLEIDKNIKTNAFIKQNGVKNALGLYLSELDFTQARIAESEKYPHVTYFFDGGYNGPIPNCDKFHIPSPDVATYDLKPEMSCVEVTKKVIQSMNNDYDFILVNFANTDMVGHTGVMSAAVKACMAIDICLGKIVEKAEENFYNIILLADHGNADVMINEDGTPCTTHTINPVPFILCDNKVKLKSNGTLVNVAPTILDYMDIAIPPEMQETESLLIKE